MILLTLQTQLGDKRPIDDELMQQVATGDMDAFHDLYDRASKSVYGFALSITQNTYDAEDVLQETFLKVYAKAGEYLPQGKPMAWIFTITRNLALSRLRQRGKDLALDDSRDTTPDFSMVDNAEQRLVLEALFRVLTTEEKEILVMHVANGLKHREIATVLEMPLNTVLSKYHRAMKKLKAAVEKEEYT